MTSPVHTQLALCSKKKKGNIKKRIIKKGGEREKENRYNEKATHRSIDRKTKASGQLVALFHPWTSEKNLCRRKCKRQRKRERENERL